MLLTLILLDMRMLLLISHERIKQPGLLIDDLELDNSNLSKKFIH